MYRMLLLCDSIVTNIDMALLTKTHFWDTHVYSVLLIYRTYMCLPLGEWIGQASPGEGRGADSILATDRCNPCKHKRLWKEKLLCSETPLPLPDFAGIFGCVMHDKGLTL